MHYRRKQWYSPTAIVLGAAAILCFLVSLAAAEPPPATPGKPVPGKPAGQAVCPPGQVPGQGTCKMTIECPTLKTEGKTVCKATIDCPPAPKKKKK